MPEGRGTWAAIWTGYDRCPEVIALRVQAGEIAELQFFLALLYAKEMALPGGRLLGCWDAVAATVRAPCDGATLADLWRRVGVVNPIEGDKLLLWDKFNGWIVSKYAEDRKRKRKEYRDKKKAAKASRNRRREKRQMNLLAAIPKPKRPRQAMLPGTRARKRNGITRLDGG